MKYHLAIFLLCKLQNVLNSRCDIKLRLIMKMALYMILSDLLFNALFASERLPNISNTFGTICRIPFFFCDNKTECKVYANSEDGD